MNLIWFPARQFTLTKNEELGCDCNQYLDHSSVRSLAGLVQRTKFSVPTARVKDALSNDTCTTGYRDVPKTQFLDSDSVYRYCSEC